MTTADLNLDDDSAAPHADAVSDPARAPRWNRVGLWRAIAGMSIAMAAGSAIVTLEFAHSLVLRTRAMNRRIAGLNSTVRTLRSEQTATARKLGSAAARASERETFARILFAPDLKITRLAGTPATARGSSVVLAVSESANAAMLEATGLRASEEGKVYRVWYAPHRGLAAWITDFIVGDDGKATVAVDLPEHRAANAQIEITLEDQEYAEIPSGPVIFKGRLREEERARR